MSDEKTNYADAIMTGVYKWMDANKKDILAIIEGGCVAAISASTEKAVDTMAGGTMVAVANFLDTNSADLKTNIAAAIATSWAARQHPVPKS